MNFKLSGRPQRFAAGLLAFAFSAAANAAVETNSAAANPLALPGAFPDTGASVLRVFGALVLVIGVFLGGVWLFRNWQRLAVKRGGAPKLNVLEVKSLGQRQAIYVVGYEQQRMLLASSPAGITLISHLPEAEQGTATASAPAAPAAPGTRMSFADAFQQVLNRK